MGGGGLDVGGGGGWGDKYVGGGGGGDDTVLSDGVWAAEKKGHFSWHSTWNTVNGSIACRLGMQISSLSNLKDKSVCCRIGQLEMIMIFSLQRMLVCPVAMPTVPSFGGLSKKGPLYSDLGRPSQSSGSRLP